MKLLILSVFSVIAVLASPAIDDIESEIIGDAGEYVRVPNGVGGTRFVSVDEAEEIAPKFDVGRDTRFLVFTRLNPTIGQQVWPNDLSSIDRSNFLSSRPTRFLIHGWQSNVNSDINILTTAAYLRSYDVNVIVVDWAIGANTINYITSRNHVNSVGALIAEFLDNLQANRYLPDFSRVYLIGHSLGAHIAGAAGKRVRNGKINTIYGLDPAGPLFDANDPSNRLASGDAQYVEVVHTDTRNFGIGAVIGDADFYPNGGSNQPGCLTQICDHNQVVPFFVETLNSDRLWGRRCANFNEMEADRCTGAGNRMGGEPSNARLNLVGIYRMPTNSRSPFGVGQF